jgi:3-methyladenine DNA glycosylase/8-oxoguanine DNA glycosylase
MGLPDGERHIEHGKALDLPRTLRPLQVWPRDPALRIAGNEAAWAIRSPEGPVSLRLLTAPGVVRAQVWGPGSEWALSRVEDFVGLNDDVESFKPEDPRIREWLRRHPGIRLPRTWRVVRMLVPIVLGQLVTGPEGVSAYKHLGRRLAEPAPGPLRLTLPPDPRRMAGLSVSTYLACGALAKQARTIKSLCAVAHRMEEAAGMDFVQAARRLQALPGLGPWTAGSAMLQGMGFPDTIILGDYHMANFVAWNLAGEARADDHRMVELLRPFKGHRGRVLRLLGAEGTSAPKRGPRMALRTWS